MPTMKILALQTTFWTFAELNLLILYDMSFNKATKLPKTRAKTMNLG